MDILQTIDTGERKTETPDFRPGDTVKVHVKVQEADKTRIQVFQGVVIARQGIGRRETFSVRKISNGIGVERVFPIHTPNIDKIEVLRRGRVRRAKLYYLRERKGKAARIRQVRVSPAEGK
jgi:large subunit ribosomal protein L19